MTKKKFLLFNPTNGLHTSYNTLQELHAAREKLLQIELEKLRPQYRILEEVFYENGDSETRPLAEDHPHQTGAHVQMNYSHVTPSISEPHPLIKKTETL
ncbi:MAG: hypothetical protein ACJ763_03985 [Bdellovibrionia bacterium]